MDPSEALKVLTSDKLTKGCREFIRREGRDPMYRVARRLVDADWEDPAAVADGIGVVLLTWNQAFYRYGPLNFEALEQAIRVHGPMLDDFRSMAEISMVENKKESVTLVFQALLEATMIKDKRGPRRSPVSVGKALHIIAPRALPLWDRKIASTFRCVRGWPLRAHEDYLRFIEFMTRAVDQIPIEDREVIQEEMSRSGNHDKSILKLLDEYLYARYTKRWIA